jgi:23S rRNA-intervening sequence protein
MTEKKYAKSHRDLIVYQKSRTLAREIFEMTKSFPKEETYSLTDQVRRSSRSVGSHCAPLAWSSEKHILLQLTSQQPSKLHL